MQVMQVMQVIQVIQVKQFIHVICTSYRIYIEKVTISSCAIWWPNLQLMQVAPSGGQICKLCKWRHLVAKFATNARSHLVANISTLASGVIWWQCATNASGTIWWPFLQLM